MNGSSDRRGTTLLELVFAAALGALLAATLAGVVGQVNCAGVRGADALTATQCLTVLSTALRRDAARMQPDRPARVTWTFDRAAASLVRHEDGRATRFAAGHVVAFSMTAEADVAAPGAAATRLRVRLAVRGADEAGPRDSVRRMELLLTPVCAGRRLGSSWPAARAREALLR